MGFLDHSEDEEEEGSHGSGGRGARFGARRQKPRSKSHHQLLLMDSVGGGKAGLGGECASEEEEEIVPLPEYERLFQSARLPGDPDPKNPLSPPERGASLTLPPSRQQQKPAAWRLLQYVRSMNKSSAGAVAAGGSWDGDSRSSDDGEKEVVDGDGDGGEEGRKDKDKQQQKKKRSSWLPDPDRRWPVQGFY